MAARSLSRLGSSAAPAASTVLPPGRAPADRVWSPEATAAEGINYELMPIVRMTIPGRLDTLTL